MWKLPAPAEVDALLESAAVLSPALSERLSAPIAMAIPSNWSEARRKILIVGQETLGWDYFWPDKSCDSTLLEGTDKQGRTDALLATYADFDLAENGAASTRNSPFWRAHRRLADSFEEGEYRKVLWTNLARCNVVKGASQLSAFAHMQWEELNALCEWQSDLLRAEIAESGAECVIFFTGPNYDYLMDRTLSEVRREELFPDVPLRQAAKVFSPDLPAESYRLYHPAYLRRKSFNHLDRLIDLMAQSAR